MSIKISIDNGSGNFNKIAVNNIVPRSPKEGEYILPIGIFKGYPISQVYEIDPDYIAYLATMASYGREPIKTLVSKAINITTVEKRNEIRKILHYRKQKHEETRWLLDFLQKTKTTPSSSEFTRRFSNSMQAQLITRNRIDLVSYKQLKIIANMWGEVYGGNIGTFAYNKAKDAFKEKMRPFWHRKHQTIDDV